VAHAAARRSSLTGNEADDGEIAGVVGLEPGSGLFLGLASNFANHDNALGLGVDDELGEHVDEVSTVEGIASNSDHCGLAELLVRGLVDCFVCEGAGAGDDADLSLRVDVTGHDADLALSGLDDAGAVGANEARLALALHDCLNFNHIQGGDSFSDTHDEVHFGLNSLKDGVGGEGRRHVQHGRVGSGGLLGFGGILEDGESEVLGASLLGVDSADHVGAVRDCLLGVEGSLQSWLVRGGEVAYVLSGHALADDLCVFVNEDVGLGAFGVDAALAHGEEGSGLPRNSLGGHQRFCQHNKLKLQPLGFN
jgi:hypothetical protein